MDGDFTPDTDPADSQNDFEDTVLENSPAETLTG